MDKVWREPSAGEDWIERAASSEGRRVSRRDLLKLAGSAGVGVAVAVGQSPRTGAAAAMGAPPTQPPPEPAPAAQQVKPVPSSLFYNFGSNHEMRWENMYPRGYLVPNDLFFIRSHTRTPAIDVATWRLRVEGSGVEAPLEISYDELLKLPSTSVLRSVECAGNGRSFFDTVGGARAEGTQWKLGAIGVAEWTGVPLREVLERARVKPTARDLMPEGLDDLRVRRPMALSKALEEDTLLAYAMNGDALPPDHGFPVRVLAPGWIGIASTKWVGRIEVSEEPLYSTWNTDSYVMIGSGYSEQPPARGPILTSQNVKSALELSWPADLSPGQHTIRGRSWSPAGQVATVEYSLDGGATYRRVTLREPNIARAWVRWDFEWNASPGDYTIRVRATDDAGNTQPETVAFNQQGYLYNAVVAHPVVVR